ncbi:MAG: hypothetical protein OZSIB_2447 [Candidatus Ozemobacter sibiricus]|jgi:hypothetical protein|uniref:Uncharacterized protein n=1 Tax=Candidatus Ozemobacter sibiricus TaxID=2268124 RepID=A0A367ZSQ4_9BACT|nr:MAG: hypothetical protein OZSIB_2447 [Candidatus Ozemobacter sibiricus]
MPDVAALAAELKSYQRLCYYPSCGTDLSDLDFFCSGQLPWGERTDPGRRPAPSSAPPPLAPEPPDLFVHTDVSFYQEFAAGDWTPTAEHGLHGSFEILGFRERPPLSHPNRIWPNLPHSGKCFEYKLRVWDSPRTITLLYCLCENEWFVADVLLAHGVRVPLIWTKNWAGGRTYGTWLVNVLDRLRTETFYADWLCRPGQRGEPRNPLVAAHYPELMVPPTVRLERDERLHWIDEGSHGWVEAFHVRPAARP